MRGNVDEDKKTERLRPMMRPYEGPNHTVVAFSLSDGNPEFCTSGSQVAEVSPDQLIFEIGSITKVFTAILLCVLVEEGKVDPRAPLSELADDLADVPAHLSPERLIAHTSGLPNIYMPIWRAAITPMPDGPYADFTRADLLHWLRNWNGKPSRAPRHAYSNLGVGLLGEAMAMQAGKPFVDLLTEKVIVPLGLTDTTDRLDHDQKRRFAQPRTTKGRAVLPWTFEALAGAGCLRSSARDMARFSAQVIRALNTPETTLDRAICRSAIPVFGLGRRGATRPQPSVLVG